jgi:TolB protein
MCSLHWVTRFLFSGLLSLLFLFFLSGCGSLTNQRDSGQFLYLDWDENGEAQLFRSNGNESQKLTGFKTGVHDYALSPNGRNLIFSTIANSGDTELWIMEGDGSQQTLLHTCSRAECTNFAWAPDSQRLLFERRDVASNGITAAPFLWWLDLETASVLPLMEDHQQHGANGQLSPDGQWLSYFSPEEEGLYLYNLKTGKSHFFTNEIGAEVAWSPDSKQLVVPQLDLVILHSDEGEDHQGHEHDYQTAVHLLRIDVSSGEPHIISDDLQVEDSVPAWSPDGNWVAFGRRAIGTGAPRQLWIMRPDGTGAKALTDDPSINHGPPVWTADGRGLIFQQIGQDDLSADPAIWRIDIKTGEKWELEPSGMVPSWLDTAR